MWLLVETSVFHISTTRRLHALKQQIGVIEEWLNEMIE